MIIMAPKDENECRQMLHTAYVYPGPAAVRYPRGSGLGVDVQQEMSLLELGRAELLAEFNPHHEQQISILAFGSRVQAALEAGQELAAAHKLGVRVVNMRFVKPLDEEIIQQLAGQTTLFVTVEEHAVMGGAGSAVNEFGQGPSCEASVKSGAGRQLYATGFSCANVRGKRPRCTRYSALDCAVLGQADFTSVKQALKFNNIFLPKSAFI